MSGMPDKGFLSEYRLAPMLQYLNRSRATGTLTLKAKDVTRKLFVQKGGAVFATSSFDEERLGEVMVRAGLVTVAQYDEAVALMKRSNKRLGSAFVELAYLTPHDLYWGVRYQVKQIVYAMFRLRDAVYEFSEGEVPAETITLDVSMSRLVHDGLRRVDDMTRIRSEMPGMDAVLMLSEDPRSLFQDVEYTDKDRAVLALVDGSASVGQILEASALDSYETLRILFALWSIGLITEETSLQHHGLTLADVLTPVEGRKEDFVSRVRSTHAMLGTLKPHQVLAVKDNSDFDLISRQYFRLSKEFHPDRYVFGLDEDIQDKVAEIFESISVAFKELKKRQIQRAYTEGDEALAEALLQHARHELRAGNFKEAAIFLEEAVRANPDHAECWNYLSLAQSKLPDMMDKAIESIQLAQGLNPGNSYYFANLGLIYLQLRRLDEAKEQFEHAINLDPKNEKAQKGLSLLLTG